jgi:hypothetical protein
MPKEFDNDDDDDSGEDENVEEVSKEEQIEEIEFNMTEEEINEWMVELKRLKEDRGTSILPIDDKMQLKLNYDEKLDMQ